MTLLEGFAAVLMVPLWAKDIQQAGGAALMCDNIGLCIPIGMGAALTSMSGL